MTTYHDRDEWTSTDASGATLTGAELVGVAVHWPGTSQAVIGIESKAQTASRLRGYRNFHVTGRGWRDIGYNVAFDQAGRVWMCRSEAWAVNMVGAHCASSSNPRANHKYVGALLILGANERPSAAMREAFADWYHNRFLARWFSRTDVRGHGQVPGASTSCPGSRARADIASGALITIITEEDMPSPKDWTGEDWAAFTDHVRGSMQHGGIVDVGAEERWSVTHALGNATELASELRHGPVVSVGIGDKHWSVPHALSWNLRTIRDMNDLLATVLANQQAIMQAQGVVVDEAALAQQIAAIVVPAVVDEFGDEVGDEVESRIRQVLGALDEAT